MVSRSNPNRHAATGFAVKDTPPEINAMIFAAMIVFIGLPAYFTVT